MSEADAETSDLAADVKRMRGRLALATGAITWLVSVIGPAITFNVLYVRGSDADTEFKAYFLVLSAVLFLLGWKFLGRLPAWMLGIMALVSVASFVGYSKAKDDWTCAYAPKVYSSRFTMGTELTDHARKVLKEFPPPDDSCQARMRPFGGNALLIWEEQGVYRHFLMLFGLYALAWLSLALLVLGTVRYSLARDRPE